VLGVPVRRAAIPETTALGAAFLAGLGVGMWANPAEIGSQWQADAEFRPARSPDAVEAGFAVWHRAVDRAGGWAHET
jgi:glycerol kinase